MKRLSYCVLLFLGLMCACSLEAKNDEEGYEYIDMFGSKSVSSPMFYFSTGLGYSFTISYEGEDSFFSSEGSDPLMFSISLEGDTEGMRELYDNSFDYVNLDIAFSNGESIHARFLNGSLGAYQAEDGRLGISMVCPVGKCTSLSSSGAKPARYFLDLFENYDITSIVIYDAKEENGGGLDFTDPTAPVFSTLFRMLKEKGGVDLHALYGKSTGGGIH